MLIPSIDLVRGQAVQLQQGRELEFVADEDPRVLARRFGRVGEVAVIDLDAARGTGDNLALIEELCALAPCRVGGGIRDVERGKRLLQAGARRLIIGTRVDPDFLEEFPPVRLLAAVDARDDHVVDRGWERQVDESPVDRARRLEPFVGGFLYTLVEREGLQAGIDIARVQALASAVGKPVTAAGGIHTTDEIRVLDRMGVDAQVGMALYRGTLGLGDGLAAVVRFVEDGDGAVTVVQDASDGRVLMVARSTRASLIATVESGEVVVHPAYRDSRGARDEAVHGLRLVRVEVDCDRRALLLLVEPSGPVCDRGTASCFGDRPFSLAQLEQVIAEHTSASGQESYTARLLGDAVTRRAKVLDEANQLVGADAYPAIRSEAADLLYHVLVELVAGGVPLEAVVKELGSRRRRPPS
ncbi:MAG: phosphoribosyl-ATP diphosphatase [Gemmatimonadota bacterium]|nr:phosphoribosyl-ATP diphosphatase [Gemmatimonadota bacterium]MDH5196577.1 phosphoribosyl-ATP diphosphatase [Gemmatimonadota bacterium]